MSQQQLILDTRREVLLGQNLVKKCSQRTATDKDIQFRKKFLVENNIIKSDCDLASICNLKSTDCGTIREYSREECKNLYDLYHNKTCAFTTNIIEAGVQYFYNDNIDLVMMLKLFKFIKEKDKVKDCLVQRINYTYNCIDNESIVTVQSVKKHQDFMDLLYLVLNIPIYDKIDDNIHQIQSILLYIKHESNLKLLMYSPDKKLEEVQSNILGLQSYISNLKLICKIIDNNIGFNACKTAISQLEKLNKIYSEIYSKNEINYSNFINKVEEEEKEIYEDEIFSNPTKKSKKKGKKSENNNDDKFLQEEMKKAEVELKKTSNIIKDISLTKQQSNFIKNVLQQIESAFKDEKTKKEIFERKSKKLYDEIYNTIHQNFSVVDKLAPKIFDYLINFFKYKNYKYNKDLNITILLEEKELLNMDIIFILFVIYMLKPTFYHECLKFFKKDIQEQKIFQNNIDNLEVLITKMEYQNFWLKSSKENYNIYINTCYFHKYMAIIYRTYEYL